MSSDCPHPTTRPSGVCKQCSVEQQFEGVDFGAEEYTCECGQPTSSPDGDCYRCRGADDTCKRCGTGQADLTRVPVRDVDGLMTLCGKCENVLRRRGRVCRPVTDGGLNAPEKSETLQSLGRARMHVTQAITRSIAEEDTQVYEHLSTAARELREIGLEYAAELLEDLRDEDCPSYLVREDLRQLAQFFDAWAKSTVEQFADQYQLRAAGDSAGVNAGP